MSERSTWLATTLPRRQLLEASIASVACMPLIAGTRARDRLLPHADALGTPSGSILYVTDGRVLSGGGPVLLHRSADGGHSWDVQPLGLPDPVWYLLADARLPGALVAVGQTPGRVNILHRAYRSHDAGQTWHLVAEPLPIVHAAALDPFDAEPWYLAVARGVMLGLWTEALNGVLCTTTGGRTWTESAFPGPVGVAARRIVPDPNTPGRLYVSFAATDSPRAPRPITVAERIAVSEDAGETWRWKHSLRNGRGSFDGLASLAAHPTVPGLVYAGTTIREGLAVSRDGGMTWQLRTLTGLLEEGALNDFVIRPDQPETLYAAVGWLGSGGVFVSRDSGHTWEPALSGLPSTRAEERRRRPDLPTRAVLNLVMDPHNPDRLVAIVADLLSTVPAFDANRELYLSHDGGMSWERGPVQERPADLPSWMAPLPRVAFGSQ